jgi:UDP-glucose 4-epimerase
MKILITGGAGFIGSFTADLFLKKGNDVTIIDNLSTGHLSAIPEGAEFINADITDYAAVIKAFRQKQFDGLIHFAAKSLVGESVKFPLKYYENNFVGTLNLVKAAIETDIKGLVFSSTAAVYGEPKAELNETHVRSPINPYGNSKLSVEYMIEDAASASKLHAISLRYFNACGCHAEGLKGEDHDPETHLIPLVVGAALGTRPPLQVFGEDYLTPDGTPVRDYIDVNDLAEAHFLALENCRKMENEPGSFDAFNVGTGSGFSVKEVISTAEKVMARKVPHTVGPRRSGDPAKLVAATSKIKNELNWAPKVSLEESIEAVLKFQNKFPDGYPD